MIQYLFYTPGGREDGDSGPIDDEGRPTGNEWWFVAAEDDRAEGLPIDAPSPADAWAVARERAWDTVAGWERRWREIEGSTT